MGRFGTLSLDQLIDRQLECEYQILNDGTLHPCLDVHDTTDELVEVTQNNRELNDTNTAQLLGQEEIEQLKDSGVDAQVDSDIFSGSNRFITMITV